MSEFSDDLARGAGGGGGAPRNDFVQASPARDTPSGRADFKLLVLGSGTLTPSATRVSSGFWVEAGPWRIRLDCGPGTLHAMARWGVPWERLTHQFVSHFHVDHVGDLGALLYALKDGRGSPRSAPFALLGPAGLRAHVDLLSLVAREELLEQEFPTSVHELLGGERLDLGDGVTLFVARTPHTAESLAVRIESGGRSLGFTGDTGPSEELARFFDGVDVLLAECSDLDPPHDPAHLAVSDTASLAARARAGHLVATHCYFDPDAEGLRERLARTFAGAITIARDGLTIEV